MDFSGKKQPCSEHDYLQWTWLSILFINVLCDSLGMDTL